MHPLWERVLVAAVPALLTVGLGVLAAGYITARAQKYRRKADTRDALAAEMYEVAGLLYFELQNFWRRAKDVPLDERRESEALSDAVEQLESTYATARTKGKVLEQRLRIYFKSRQPALAWHRVMDLLSVRHFLLLEAEGETRKAYRDKNAGDEHTGLSAEQLNAPAIVLRAYRASLPAAVACLWQYELDWRGQHVRSASDIVTWSEGDDDENEDGSTHLG